MLERKPLWTYTCFRNVKVLWDYRGPTLDVERPDRFPNDKVFVEFDERQSEKICGPYLEKEEEAKMTSPGSKRRLNRVFDAMGVEYDERPLLADAAKDEVVKVKGKKPQQPKGRKTQNPKGQRCVVQKHKAFELADIRLGPDLARPSKQSQKFTLDGTNTLNAAPAGEMVCADFR